MESDIENSDMESATRVMKARMAKAACLHLDHVDGRAAIALQIAGVFKRGSALDGIPSHVLEVVNMATHPLRVACGPGPFMFYRANIDTKQQFALNMANVLLCDDVGSRSSAVSHFEALAALDTQMLTPKTLRLIQEKRTEIFTSNPESWQPAAQEIFDAVEEDLLCQLAAVGQSMEQHFEDGLREYFPKVLCPSLSSLEALELILVRPSQQKADIVRAIADCVDRDTLQAACSQYLRVAGFLPLASDYSLARVVQYWQFRHDSSVNLWDSLWAWADSTKSPLARYHVCMAFLEKPEWGTLGRERVLWQEIIETLSNFSMEDEKFRWKQEWSFRKDLAQHYLRLLESRAPGALSEPLACFAWWLSDRMAGLVGHASEVTNNLHNIAIIPETQNSDYAWRLALPRTVPSVLANATHMGASPWSLSTLQRITSRTLNDLSSGLDEEIADIFDHGMAAVIMYGFPIKAVQPTDAVYAFETIISETVAAWCAHRAATAGADVATAISTMYGKLSNAAEFVLSLEKMYEEDEANQMIIAYWAKSLAMQGALPQEAVWKYLSDSVWRKQAFTKVVEPALDELLIAFSIGLDRDNKVWSASLSHIYASACEEVGADMERRNILFGFTAISGIHTYSVSALQRLLSSNQRSSYLEVLSKLRSSLLSNRNNPAWLTARIRAVLAATSDV